MSSGKTHMLVGGVAGMAVARWLGLPLLEATTQSLLGWGAVAASTVLATLPDIDQPRSWIAQRVRLVVTLASAGVGVFMGLFALRAGVLRPFLGVDWVRYPGWLAPIVLGLLGLLIVGPVGGSLLLRIIRVSAGGHRRLTHSGLLAAVLAGVAWWLWRNNQVMLAGHPGQPGIQHCGA